MRGRYNLSKGFKFMRSKSMLLASVALMAAAFISTSANAADPAFPVAPTKNPLYVSVFGGASFLNEVHATSGGNDPYIARTNMGYILGGAVGYQFNEHIRAEVELSHSSWHVNSYNSSGRPFKPATGSISETYLLGNIWYDIPTHSAFTPYVGGGLGAGFTSADALFNGGTHGYGPPLSQPNLAFQIGAGVKFDLSEKLALDVGYRFKDVTGVHFGDTGGKYDYRNATLASHNVQIGLTFRF